ncbi:MAG TPA: SURF1 family protein [Actinomycetota bacterium]
MTSHRARRLVLLGVAMVAAAVCVRLGFWQLDRLEQRRALNARIEAGLAGPPQPVEALLDAPADEIAFRRVTASGTWDAAHEVLLYGRALDGRPGNHVLTPLVLGGGRAIVVDRGWVPTDASGPPMAGEAAAADGPVSVTGTLLPSEDGDGDEAAGGIVRAVDVAALDGRVPADLVPGRYLLLASQEPAAAAPTPAAPPEPDEGPHLSYAIQWFAFAAIALVGYVLLARRDRAAAPGFGEG